MTVKVGLSNERQLPSAVQGQSTLSKKQQQGLCLRDPIHGSEPVRLGQHNAKMEMWDRHIIGQDSHCWGGTCGFGRGKLGTGIKYCDRGVIVLPILD